MKTAIVLFNLGGPDEPAAVRKFRINLFSDPAIIRAPFFIRFWLARLIAGRSEKAAVENYALLGGKSPLLGWTLRQAAALEAQLADTKCFVAMRYWHPLATEAVQAVLDYDPDRILLLPLYPQFSTTTTGSSFTDWHEQAAKAGLVKPTTRLCCYYDDAGYADAVAALVQQEMDWTRGVLGPGMTLRLLFSAHGLPESIVKGGDPYQEEVEGSVAAVLARLQGVQEHVVCYQSRATPQMWLGPSTIEAIETAAQDQVAVLLVPIAFVSDHIETLVELDVENRDLAKKLGVPGYFRAPVGNDEPKFMAALAGIAARAMAYGPGLCSHKGERACGVKNTKCPWGVQ